MPKPKITVEQPMSAKDRLLAKAKKTTPSAAKKKAREIISLDNPEDKVIADAVDRLTAAVHARKAIEGHEKAAKAVVLPHVRSLILQDWIEQGRKTDNPRVQTPSGSSFILQCKDTLTGVRGFRVPKDDSGTPVDFRQHLESAGLPPNLIEEISSEFKDELVLSINMVKLEKEHASLAEKLMSLIAEAGAGGVTTTDGKKIKFSDDDMEKILDQNHDVTVEEGFLERSVTHCKAVAENQEEATDLLSKLLYAVPPQWAVGQANCLKPEEGIVKMLREEPKVVAPTGPPVDHETPDQKYTLRMEGYDVKIIRNSDKKELAKKTCKDAMHTANTVNKWMREPDSLSGFISENV